MPSPSQASSSTKKERKRKLDNFDKVTIRNAALRLLSENKTLTVSSLKRALADKLDASVSKLTTIP